MVHTLILSTAIIILPSIGHCKLVLCLIENNKVDIDYFGVEIDNPADYMDEEMEAKIKNTTYINIHFEDEEIEYSKYSKEEILKLAKNLLVNLADIKISADDKDIDIYV
ncbi:hypothetical protein [Flavobacterium sp. TAB 87]|uniref:hypothetical protein n=1 Tax=Flavobacterium sp. TAB 87 TaxID=1729581 RepID=UPI00076C096C|nr:hypothetical protein [Flavobacterium sp. TAB 87]KVV16343.1 hypothetical protein AP058_00095 [Flavobacterium sp. TAB 87]